VRLIRGSTESGVGLIRGSSESGVRLIRGSSESGVGLISSSYHFTSKHTFLLKFMSLCNIMFKVYRLSTAYLLTLDFAVDSGLCVDSSIKSCFVFRNYL
jgi:hypothetical protein